VQFDSCQELSTSCYLSRFRDRPKMFSSVLCISHRWFWRHVLSSNPPFH